MELPKKNPFRDDMNAPLTDAIKDIMEGKINEGGVKAAIEDFMYDMLPKQAIAELKPIFKNQGIRGGMLRAKVTAVLKKYKVPLMHLGGSSAQLVIDYFDTFHGESVEEHGEELTEAQQAIGKYRFTSFTEGSIKGWKISVQGMGEVGFVEEPAKKNSKTSVAPHKVFFYQSFKGAGSPSLMANFYPGTETRVPNEKEVRFAPRQLLKAVSMWMDKYGYEKIEHAKKEEVEVSEAELTKVGYALVVDNKIVFRGSKQQCLKKAKEHGGLKMGKVFITLTPKNIGQAWQKEEVEEAYAPLDTPNLIGAFTEATKKKRFEYRNSTDSWGKSHGFPHEVCVNTVGSSQGSPSVWRSANVKGTVCYLVVDEGEEGKPVTEKWTIRNHVKYVKAD